MVEVVQFISVLYLCGLIWTIQLVHYPSFHFVDQSSFRCFCRLHYRRISVVVIPAMLAELVCGVYLLFRNPSYGETLHILLLGILAVIWTSTFFIQVPIHRRLQATKSESNIKTLVKTNWIRTFGWTLRGVIFTAAYFTGGVTIMVPGS